VFIDQLLQDLRIAARGLRKSPGFTVAAVLTLAIGSAGTIVMFALIHGVLLRPLPVRDQDRLVLAWKELRASSFSHHPFGAPDIEAVGEHSQLFEDVAGVTSNGVSRWVVTEGRSSIAIGGALVTGGVFDVLGVEPVLGRALNRHDEKAGAEKVIVIAYALWQRRYGGSHDIVGRRLTIDDQPFTIVGVMPPDFEYPPGADAWRTTRSVPTSGAFGDAAQYEVDLIGRLRPGVTIGQATEELGALIRRLEVHQPVTVPRGMNPVVRTYKDVVVGDVRPAMLLLFAAVGFVLVIAAANVANLLLMRGEVRRPELAVRSALGAGRARLVRQLLVESLVLALAAGALGLAVAYWSLHVLVALVPGGLPRAASVRIDLAVVLFTIGIGFLSAALAGLAPAFSLLRTDLVLQLRGARRNATPGTARRGRRALVVAQVALAVLIVAGAGLLIRSLLRLQSLDMGFASDQLVFVDLSVPQLKYADRERHRQLLEDLAAQLSGTAAIVAATAVNVAPFSGTGGWDVPRFTGESQSVERAMTNPSLNLESVFPNYFATCGITLLRGRFFTKSDRQDTLPVAIVSETIAERVWPGENALGRRLKMGGMDSRDPWRTVVGVVRETRYRNLREPAPTLYLPADQFLMTAQTLVLRTAAPLGVVAALSRDRVRSVDPTVHVLRVVPLVELLQRPLAQPRFNAFLLGVFGSAALLLASIGLYSVMGAYVRQRRAEIGVRVALGATPSDVRGVVLGEGLKLAGIGVAVGVAASLGAVYVLRGWVFGVQGLDLTSMLLAALTLLCASALATYLPARRAALVDPIETLRAE
jgi:predicted permease